MLLERFFVVLNLILLEASIDAHCHSVYLFVTITYKYDYAEKGCTVFLREAEGALATTF